MATILQFRPSAEAKARIERPAEAEGTLGEIIIFPGVRIERRASAEPPRRCAPVRRRARSSRKK